MHAHCVGGANRARECRAGDSKNGNKRAQDILAQGVPPGDYNLDHKGPPFRRRGRPSVHRPSTRTKIATTRQADKLLGSRDEGACPYRISHLQIEKGRFEATGTRTPRPWMYRRGVFYSVRINGRPTPVPVRDVLERLSKRDLTHICLPLYGCYFQATFGSGCSTLQNGSANEYPQWAKSPRCLSVTLRRPSSIGGRAKTARGLASWVPFSATEPPMPGCKRGAPLFGPDHGTLVVAPIVPSCSVNEIPTRRHPWPTFCDFLR